MIDQIVVGVVLTSPEEGAAPGADGRPAADVRRFKVREQVFDEAGARWATGREIEIGDFYRTATAPRVGDVVRLRTAGVVPVFLAEDGGATATLRATLRRHGIEVVATGDGTVEQLPLL